MGQLTVNIAKTDFPSEQFRSTNSSVGGAVGTANNKHRIILIVMNDVRKYTLILLVWLNFLKSVSLNTPDQYSDV